jgi:flagellar motor switch protein FliM
MYGKIIKNKKTTAFLLANEKLAFSLIDALLGATERKMDQDNVNGVYRRIFLSIGVLFMCKTVQDAMNHSSSTQTVSSFW